MPKYIVRAVFQAPDQAAAENIIDILKELFAQRGDVFDELVQASYAEAASDEAAQELTDEELEARGAALLAGA